MSELHTLIDMSRHKLNDPDWLTSKRDELDMYGAVQMHGFLTADALTAAQTDSLSLDAGDLLLFRGRNSLHRVTPVADDSVRHLAVPAYNSLPGISLSETAQMTFYGRVGKITAAE